jgi:hypothetical protein
MATSPVAARERRIPRPCPKSAQRHRATDAKSYELVKINDSAWDTIPFKYVGIVHLKSLEDFRSRGTKTEKYRAFTKKMTSMTSEIHVTFGEEIRYRRTPARRTPLSMPHTSGIVEANGVSLYFQERGAEPQLLLISGASVDASDYAPVASLLAEEFTTITKESPPPFHPAAEWLAIRLQDGGDLTR